MFNKFKCSECGASLVEYAVALIVVTIVGGGGVLAIGNDTETLASAASTEVEAARIAAQSATSS